MEKTPETNVEPNIEREKGLAVVVIKPDAFRERAQIIDEIRKAGLYIVKSVERKLPYDFVQREMYPGSPKDIEDATGEHFSMDPCTIVLVEGGEDVIKRLVEITGEKTDPAKCEPETFRHKFGRHESVKMSAGKPYFMNAIHRAKDEEERVRDLNKFRQYLN